MKWPVVSLIFLKSSPVFPILMFSSISLNCSLRKASLTLLAVLWNSTLRWLYLPLSPLPFASVLFSGICKTSWDNYFAFGHFFSLVMILVTASCTMLWFYHEGEGEVAQSCLTLCDPMNCSTPGLPVHHQLPEFTQTHVHRVGDAIQPSHPLTSPSPPAPNPSQHQSLFQWANSSHEVAKVLEFQL